MTFPVKIITNQVIGTMELKVILHHASLNKCKKSHGDTLTNKQMGAKKEHSYFLLFDECQKINVYLSKDYLK